MTIFLKKLAFCFLAALVVSAVAQPVWAKSKRVNCGDYSFIMPDGYTLTEVIDKHNEFQPEFTFQLPSNGQSASVICLREKKTDYYDFALLRKHNIRLQTAPRQFVKMFISATQSMTTRNGLHYNYIILEETAPSTREVRGMRYFPILEMNAVDDEYHTMIIVSDSRSEDDFFNMEEYRSNVNRVAAQIIRTMNKPAG